MRANVWMKQFTTVLLTATTALSQTALCTAIGFSAICSIALAQDLSSATTPLSPGTFTTSVHSDEWKIANALSAGPTSITAQATVMDWPADPKDGLFHGECFARAPMVGHACPTFRECLTTPRCATTKP